MGPTKRACVFLRFPFPRTCTPKRAARDPSTFGIPGGEDGSGLQPCFDNRGKASEEYRQSMVKA